ncbi:Domain of unknown function DUF815 domain and P-loop containing nucleoside triphosphate hydrolase domain-containing protein [Strongyloides ratti]|uniref:Origin recognition complex subunit 4 n=1 Tax=Strongyloides ratti TaxID=34506 RepID=A0A090L8X4_STRRB|nr:Domain of unknown function DUF815 domain and P-loop containing nucleoside triphosphate hydrolase domain-containing protein [Strongyloides ratti]CEF66191.1 Domain of unknown function DUF815 domain and P-loop containing nucleoside triphosphate hydrolase domain-containing protein [Strongyloides ratti]
MRVLENLKLFDKKLYGVDKQIEKLRGIINEFSYTNRGGSCLVVGPKGTGKTSSLRLITGEYEEKIETIFLDCIYLTSNATGLKMLEDMDDEEEMNDKLKIIVLENFELFSENRDQILLYKLLNETRNRSWYVFLVSDLRDVKNCLEKRVRSRISNIEIVYTINMPYEEYLKYFKIMLLDSLFGIENKYNGNMSKKMKEVEEIRNELIDGIIYQKDVYDKFENLYMEDCSMLTLKKIVVLLVSKLYYKKNYGNEVTFDSYNTDIPPLLFEIIELIVPTKINESILKGLTIRQLCLLICIIKLMRNTQNIEFLYHNIYKSYLRFKNQYNSFGKYNESDVDIYKELDTLVERGLIQYTNESQMGQLCFRRVKIGVDPVLIEMCIREYKPLPSCVKVWLEDTIEMI